MSDPTTRALRLLSLLQTHRFWSGSELAGRLEVSERTLRRDVDRLRELGYDVAARPGTDGGYQLASGGHLPPLLLDDDEAVAIAVGLRTAAIQGLGDGEQTSLSALAKIEQVLPAHLRRRVSALQEHTVPAGRPRASVAAEVLGHLALTCRDHERLRFRYTDAAGTESARLVEPHSLVPRERRWYFVAWDVDRGDWRTFRIDRMSALHGTGVRFVPRQLPTADAAEYVASAHSRVGTRHVATVHLQASLEEVRAHFGGWARGAREAGDGVVDWDISGGTVQELVATLSWIPLTMRWTLTCTPEVADGVARFRASLAGVVAG